MKTLTFKVSDDEAKLIRSRAKREDLSVSEYLRRSAKGSPTEFKAPEMVRCDFTGAAIFGSLEGQVVLTAGDVKELLSDFP